MRTKVNIMKQTTNSIKINNRVRRVTIKWNAYSVIKLIEAVKKSEHLWNVNSRITSLRLREMQQPHHHPGHPPTITVVSNPSNSTLLTVSTTDANGEARPQFVYRECGSAFNIREARLHTGDNRHFLSTASLNSGPVGRQIQIWLDRVRFPCKSFRSPVRWCRRPTRSICKPLSPLCPQCLDSMAILQQQQQHVVTISPANRPISHFCASCGKGFAAKHGLMQHNRRHPNGVFTVRIQVCECGKAFFQKDQLMLHQRQHL